MDRYLNNCYKAARAATSKAAASSLTANREQYDSSSQKDPIPEVGAANLLDLPLADKLPVVPESNNVFYTTNLSEKLYQPSYDFNLSDPYCWLLQTSYKSLHNPHLKSYCRRKDILRRLKKDGYVTSNNKKMIEKQVNILYETKRACDSHGNTQFQDWLLQENKQTTPDQELLIKQRYLDMISLELNKLEHMAEKQNVLWIKEEERRHQDHIRGKLSLWRQIEEKWKTKEILLLSKIGEEVKREARFEKQHKKVKEDAHHKKKAQLEKKITYYLQKMQRNDLQREGSEENVFENKSQDETEGEREIIKDKASYPKIKKVSVTAGHQKSHQGQKRPSQHLYSSVKTPERRSTLLHSPHDVQSNTTEQKKDRETIRTSCPSNDGEITTLQSPGVSAKTPSICRYSLQDTSKQQVTCADLNGEKAKKSSLNYEPAPGVSFIHDSPIRQDYHPNRCQEKVTSEELNSIIQNVMTWVVAAVTSVLYPAITKYEERLQNITCPMPDNSTLSSDSESCCGTCCETFLYETSKMVQAEPCTEAADRSIEQPVASSKSSFARKERTDVETTYHRKEHLENKPKAPKPKYNEISESPNLKTCKSDSHPVVQIETDTRKCKDATTETDSLECPLSSDEKAKAINEMQELNNVFVNFKHHLKEEAELILRNIFQEMVSELTQTIPSVTTESLPTQTDTDKGDLLSNVDISSAAAEIMGNVLEKLQSAVKKTCTEEFSPENISVHFKPDLVSGEYFISPKEKTSEVSLPYALENMNDVAEDMVHVILEKLMVLASSKQSELAHVKITTDPASQQHREDPTYTFLQRASKRKSSAKTDAASLIGKEEIRNLVSTVCSQSSLVGYVKEAISTVLGYIQVGLHNERLVATEETVIILQLLDALLAQLHQKPVKTDVRKSGHSRMSSPSGTEERNRLTRTGVAGAPRCGSLFPPINVPGVVLYSEDKNEEIDRIVENVLISSIKDEKAKLQEQVPDYWLTGENADFKHKRNMNLPTKPAYGHKVAFHDQGLNTDLPTFNKDPLKDKPGLNKDILLFSQDETYQIEKASEDIIRSILAKMFKDLSSGPSDHSDYEDGREASLLTSRKPQDPSHQESMDQMFSVSEIHMVSQDIVDAILKILHITSLHIIEHSSSVHQTSLDNADIPNKESLQIWFDSKRNMKFLSALSLDPTKLPWVESGTSGSTSESIDNLNDKIINTIFKKLNSFICPKLQTCFKPESHAAHSKPAPDKKSSFRSHLSTFTTKVVKIVLDAIQKELQHNRKNLNVRKDSPPKNFRDTGFFADAENELDSVVTKLNNDIMTSSLATCICEVLSGNTDKSNILLPSDKLRSKISHGTDGIDQQKLLPSHHPRMQEEVHQCTRFQVLDRIGDALYDMLCKLTGDHPHSPLSDEQNTEGINKNLRTTSTLQSNIKLISHTILEGIVSKLCGVETDSIFKNSEFKAISEHIDTDSPSFALLLEEMSRCYEIISCIASNVTWPGSQEVTNKGKTTAPKTGTTKEKHLNKLKTLASDVFEMVFAKLEGFANRNLENLGAIICGNKKDRTYCESENTNICGNTHEKRLQSTLYRHAKKVSGTILKVLQTELNMNLPDSETCISKPLQEKQILKSLVNFILDAISPDMFNEPEPEEKGMENYRYRPIYGNFLPGGADPDSYLEDPADTEKESAGEERPAEDETKSDSLKQQELEKTLKTFEVELKEPKKSPVVPIVRNILNEIFQNDLIGQLKVFTLPQSHLCDIPHADDEPFAQTSVQSLDETVGPLVSEADVTIVADDVVRTIFQKLHSAAMTDRNESENRYNTITFPADISFPKHTQGGKSPVYSTILDRNPCTLQSTFNIGKLTKINVVEDIVQSILTNLEAFATSKVKALFCSHISFTVPVALPSQQDEIALQQPWLSTKDSHSEDQFSCCSMDHSKSGKTTSICQLSASKLNMYATEVARQILQGIKQKLDQDISPFLTQSVVAFESIPSQVVSTVLDIVSTKGKYEKNVFDRETDPVAPEDIIEKLFNKSDYRKKLQFQILDTIEGILIDICEETIDENNLPLAVSTLKSNVSGRHLETKPERDPRYANKAILTLLVPKECVAMISNDMVDIVLQNLTSAIMVRISANDSISPRLSTAFSDAFSKAEHQQSPIKDSVNGRAERQQPLVTDSVNERAKRKQPPIIDSVNERKRERFPFARKGRDVQLKSALSDDNQTTVLKKQDAKNSASDPCKENAHFITKTILNRLKSFATERIDWLLILHPETREKPDVGSEFTNCKQNGSVFLESNQTPLDVTVPKIPTAGNILNQEVTNYTLAHYRENHRPAIHISQASLKEYADLIANTILTLIKNDIDLEIQKMYTYQNNTSFQENIIASETIKNILKSLCNKISLKASGFYSKEDPDLVTQLAVQNEIVPGQRKMEDNTKLSLLSKYSGENQKTPEVENQRRTLEEIFRNGEPGQEKTNSLLSVVKEILKKAYQRVLENTEHCSPFNELPHFTSDSKMKTSARKKASQSHISSVANDIVESVYTKIFLVIMTSLYENSERGEMEASGSDGLLMNPSCFRELKQAEKSSVPPKPVIPEVHPYTGIGSVSSLENTLLQFSPLRLGEHLVQKVLKKITDFALLNLEKNSSPKGQSDEILRPCNSKASPKGSPRASVKTNFKTKSKVTSLSKFGTKPHVGPSGAKAQSKTKLGPREKTLKGSWSKTSVGLPHLLSIGEAKNPSLKAKLPTAELKMYARDILHNILQTIVNEFEEVRQNRAVANENTLLSDQIERASGIVSAVLQGLHAMKNNLANPIKGSHSDDLKLPWGYFSTTSAANPEAHFSLETVSSQLDKLFPKEDIFKQMYDKWQTESSNMDNEKYKLLVIAEAVLNVISTKAKELEQSVSLLSLSLLEPCESSHHLFKRAASRVEDSQAQINIFGQEIIKKLFEKLELCFLTQMFTMDSKEILQSKKETAARRKCGSSRTNNLNDVPTYNTKLKDKTLGIAGHQITQILEGVLNTLESFADLQFKHVSTYAFSEIVRTPIENFFAVQQKPAMKTIFPKLQTLTTFPDESKSSSMISQENIHNALQQLYLFHSELLTYAVNTVTDMLSIIKNKLDKEKCHKEPSSTSVFEENIVASQIISTLIDQCTYFYELMIKSHPKENLLQGAKNPCTVNCSRFTTGLEMSTSKSKGISCWDDPPQISGLLSYSEEDMKIKDKTSLDVPSYVRYSIGDSTKTIESMEGLESEFKPSSSRSEAQAFGHSDQAVKGDYSLPEGTVLPISSQKSSDSAQAALEHPMSFRETEEDENQRVLHYEPLKPVVNPDEIQTTISPLKISLAAEDIVNTMLTSFGLSNQTSHSTENMETMKPFYISKEMLHCLTPEQLKNEKSLLKIWEKRNSYGTEEENKGLVASGEDSILLEKWKNKYPKLEKTLEEPGVIAFADWELGPHEVHLVARYVTTSVVTHFNNFETRGPVDEKVSISSTPLSKKYASKQPLRSINTDSSLNQFCEHLTELVISYIISSISDCTRDGETKQKSLGNEDTTCSEVILVHSQLFEHQSISIRGLALSISEVIIQILLNSDILKEDVTKVVSVKAKYIYCPKAAVADFSDLFQDLLIGVIHVLSKEIGINHHLDSKGKNKSLSTPKSHSLLNCNKAKTMKRQIHAKGWKSAPTHQLNQLIQKGKLNSLAYKLNTLVGSLRSPESKEVVNKIFNIVFDLFLPDECPNWDTDSGKTARKMFLSSNNPQSHRIPRNNLGLSPKSAFLLNVVCEKLIRTLLEECTTNNFLTNSPLSEEISTERQLFNTLQSIDDYSSLTMDCGLPFEEYDMSDLFENLAEIDQESMLSIISHSLVKSLMEKLSCSIQQPPRSPPVTDKHLTYRTSERPPSFPKAKRPELKESKQSKNSVQFMSYDSKLLTGPSNNLRVIHSKMQTPFSKQFSGKLPSLPPLRRPDKKAIAFLNIRYPGGMNTGVYSATFLEEIIADIFLNLTTSLQGKNVTITEAQLNETNILDINCVVNEFNTAQVTVLRDIEEKMCFPPVYKETVSKIVDSVYNDVSWDYTFQVTCSDHLVYAAMSIAEQITSGILKESIDYQLPLCFIRKLMPNSYYPLKAENILLKLQNNLSELNYQSQHSTGYITMLSYSFLADVIRRLLSQLIPPPSEASCLGSKYLKTSDFNEVSTCMINKVLLAISKHKIWLTKYDCQCVYTEQNLQNMVESIYNNILQMSDSLGSIQKSIGSQSPIIVDRMASLIIQEIIEHHLQPFLCEEGLPHSMSPLDEISNMVKEVLGEVTGSHRPQKSSSLGIRFYPNAFVEEIVARLLSKIFNPKYNMESDLDKMTPKIVNSINNHFKKAKIFILHDDQEQPFPTVDTDTMDELVNSVYKNVLKQHGLAVDSKEIKDSDIFAENITNLIVAAISDYLFHPLFSGDLSASSYTILTAENIIQNIFRGITKPTQPSQHLSPYNTLLPYTFLEEIIRELLSRIFPSASNLVPYSKTPKDRSEINHSEISSKLISDIRMKISQHEIRFSKDEDETESIYSEDDVQRLVDSTLRNIGQNSGSQEAVEHYITSSDNVFIDRIASFIIKNICQQHLHPFLYGKLPFTSSYRYFDSTRRRHSFFASVYPSAFLEDVISGVLSKIFHRALGIVQTKSLRDSEKELLETAEKFIYLITEEFSKVQVSTLENAEEQLCLPPVDRDIVIKIINTAYSKVLQEYELQPNKDFFSDTKTLAERLTKIILAEVFDFQIPPYFIAKLPFKSYSKLNADVLIKRVHYAINTSRLRRQTCTTYTTILSHTHLEKIVTQVLSQICLLNCSAEDPYFLQSDFNNTVVRLIDEIMSIISKHAICIIKDGNEKQSVISENSIQAMVDAIYTDISHLKLYQSVSKDKKGISNIPVTKIASYIIREIFNHHLESFLPGDKTLPCTMEQIYQQRATDPKQRELSFIVNSAVFLEEVISELLCKILCIFSYVLATENPCKAKANVTDIVTRLVKSIVLEFTTSQILVADHLHENLYFSEVYKEMVKKTVNIIYEKILDDYQSLFHIYRAIQDDAVSFGEKIYHLLLEEIYDYQVESLVLGKLETSSYSSLQEENIIRNVLNTINNDSHDLPSCITVLPCSLLENMIYKLLARMFPSPETEIEPNEEEVPPDYEFVNAASKLTDDIIAEISEHEIRLAEAEEHGENLQLGASDDFVDSICNNIIKKIKFEDEVQKDAYKRGGSFLGRIAGFIMKEIMDHHLQPFLCDEKSFPSDLPRIDDVIELLNPIKEKIQSFPQTSVYSATFLEDVVIDLVHKFYTLPRIAENPKDKEISERSIMGLAIKFANVLIGEFRKSEIKVLTNAEKMFSFPPVDKETVDKVCDSVYDEVTEIYGSKNVQKHDRSNTVIEMVAALTKKAISAFKIQPLFSGGWSSTLFSFLDVDSIMQRIQHLPYKTFTKINRSLKENPVSSLEQLSTLIPLTSDLKNKMDTLEIDGRAVNGKENFKKKTLMKTGSIQQPICINISSSVKSKVTTIALESFGGMAKKKKGDEKKKETSIGKDENISKLTSTTTSVKSKDTPGPDLGTAFTKNEIKKKDRVSRKDEKGRGDELYQHLSPAMDDIKNKVVLEPGFEICGKKSDKKKGSSLGKGDIPLELPSLTSKVRNTEIQEKRRDSPAYPATNDKKILHSKHAQNVPVSIYRNVLETSSLQGPVDDLNYPSLLGENAAYVTQACGKDFAQHASVNSAQQNAPPKEEESEIQRQPRKWDNPQNLLENKPRIFPANFLEDVISEIVNKLIFSSSLDTYDACQNVTNDVNPAELYGMAMKLIDSLLKEFSDAQIKVLNPDQGIKFLPSEDNISAVHKAPLRQKKLSVVKRPSKKKIIMDNIPPIHNMAPATKIPSSDQAKIPSIDKMLVNKVVHSSICNILQDYRSQDSICEDINFNVEKLAKRLANAVMEEILQYQLNLLLYDEVSDSKCLPLESKKVMKKVHKVAQTACKECQTSSPYTIMLPYEFLERIISSLLSRIFSTVANAKTEMSEDNLYTELDFLQMKLASTVKTEISKDEDMIIQYVKSLHPNDDEIIQLVVQTVYNNLLPQFGSQENIRKCISSGCKILSEAIVNLVVQEVTGNQLQNYFSGELTPLQCTEIDSTIENILRGIIQTNEVPQPQPSWAYKLPFNIIEEIAVKFLSRLLSMFPKADKEQNNSLNTEMQKISSKILSSFQQYISKSHITVVPRVKESSTVSLTDSATIEKIVTSVYSTVLKHCGSHISVYKDLMGKSNVLSDIIGFLMVKEISNSEFHPQEQEETSSSELVLEAVKIMEKVAKIIDDLKSKKKPPTEKEAVLDARFLEEILALFLAKLAKLPSASSKDAENLSKPELNKIASQLTKSVTAEISRKNISIVAANTEEYFLNPESIEIISQMVDSVYNCVLQQSGTHEELYHDMKDTNHIFPKEVASLIIRKVSSCPLAMISSGDPCANLFGDLDIDRIVEKVHEHAIKIEPGLEQKGLDQGLRQEELSVRIIPHLGKAPINIDPDIVAEHLGVISIKTQSLEKLQTECLTRTGHSIETLRRASINGKRYSTEITAAGNRKKEKRISLDQMGRLNVKPLEASSRNSFQSLIKPDITKVELLKDVQSKKDLIIRLITHDISQENLENKEESLASDEDEVVLQEVIKEEEFPESPLEDQVKEDMNLTTSTVAHPKPPISKCSLKKFLSVGKCQPKSSVTIIPEVSPAKQTEYEQTLRSVSSIDVTTSKCSTVTNSPWEKKTQLSETEMRPSTEPTHHFIHRMMSASSYNEEDLPSFTSFDDERSTDPSAKVTEESLESPCLENLSSLKFLTLYQRRSDLTSQYSSNDATSDFEKPHTSSRQGSEMMRKISSTFSKVFSRSNTGVPKTFSPSPPHRDRK